MASRISCTAGLRWLESWNGPASSVVLGIPSSRDGSRAGKGLTDHEDVIVTYATGLPALAVGSTGGRLTLGTPSVAHYGAHAHNPEHGCVLREGERLVSAPVTAPVGRPARRARP